MPRQERLVIHTTPITKKFVSVDGKRLQLTSEEYERFKQNPNLPAWRSYVEIQENAALLLGSTEGSEVSVDIQERRQGHVKGVSVTGQIQADGGWGRIVAEEGKKRVTELASGYAGCYGVDHPPRILERLVHFLGAIFPGSDSSADFYGPEGRNIPVPREVQSGRKKAGEIDRGRKKSYDDLHSQILAVPNARDVGEGYNGDEVDREFMSTAPSRNPAVHITGTALGERRRTDSLDGYSGKIHATAADIERQTNGRIPYQEALVIAENSVLTTRGGEIVALEPVGFTADDLPSQQSGGIEYTIGKKRISQEEWNRRHKKR